MENINDIENEYLVNVNTEKGSSRLDVYTRWNSMTNEERTGWYKATRHHLKFKREDAKAGLRRMIWNLVTGPGYDGMFEAARKLITEDHISQTMAILDDITRSPVFLVLEEYGEMIDPDIDVVGGESKGVAEQDE